MLGETIGNFKIVQKLGRGGMGEVWLGEQQSLGTRVAIKVLLEAFPADSEDVVRFFNEARAVSRIQHAGITKIFDSGILPNGRAYLVMEYLDGESLAHRIQRRAVTRTALADIGRQIASVLDATHNAGITHRDLKPENVFLVADREQPRGERVKVLDFGVAKLTGTIAPNSPRTFGTLGTPMYMAPEQWGDASQVDWRADLYSLGCVAFEMACGRPPFPCKSVAEACAKHLNDTPVLASSLAPGVPEALDRLIAQLLAKDPADRPRSMREVARAFEVIGQQVGVDGTSETLSLGSLPPNADVLATMTAAGEARAPRTQPGRKTGLVVGASVIVVGAGAAIGVFAIKGRDQPAPVVAARPIVTEIPIDAASPPDAASHDQTLAAIVQLANGSGGSGSASMAAGVAKPARGAKAFAPVPTIDRPAVLALIKAHRAQFQQCNAHRDEAERFELTFTIGLDGHPSQLAARGGSDGVAGCAMNVVRGLVFPLPQGGPVQMAVPLVFDADPIRIPPAELPEKLPQDALAYGLKSAEPALDACMAANHVADKVVLSMTIEPSGTVSATDAVGELAGSAFATCAFDAMKRIKFPQTRTRMKLTVPVTP